MPGDGSPRNFSLPKKEGEKKTLSALKLFFFLDVWRTFIFSLTPRLSSSRRSSNKTCHRSQKTKEDLFHLFSPLPYSLKKGVFDPSGSPFYSASLPRNSWEGRGRRREE